MRSDRYQLMDAASKHQIKSSVWSWLLAHIETPLPFHLSQKINLLLVLLFRHHYPTDWPSFFEDIIALVPLDAINAAGTSTTIDILLEIGLTIDAEVVCSYIQRSPEDTVRNTNIKDFMRDDAIPRLVSLWKKILMGRPSSDFITRRKCLRLIALYIPWIDINLIITPDLMTVLYLYFSNKELCIAACECLSEIVLKGMPKADKLKLLQMLNVSQVLTSLHHSQDTEFDEAVAKLINNVGLELCFCYNDAKSDIERQTSLAFLDGIFPFLIEFLANEYDDTTTALTPYLAAYLLILKRLRRANQPSISAEKLLALTQVLVQKSKYDASQDYSFGPDAGEDEALFLEMRKMLKVQLESIAAIDDELFTIYTSSLVCSTLETIRSAGHWSDVELPLHLIFIFTEAKTHKAINEPNTKAHIKRTVFSKISSTPLRFSRWKIDTVGEHAFKTHGF